MLYLFEMTLRKGFVFMAMVKDMTKGRETPLLVKFMLPMLLGNVFQQFYNIVDSAIVGKFQGATALGAIGCTGSLNFLFFSVFNGLSVGAGVLIAQNFGAKKDNLVKNTVANSLYIVTIIGVIISVISFVTARPILAFLQTPEKQLEDAIKYMKIMSVGMPAVALYNYAAQAMRALGDSKTPLIFLVIASIINVVLDIVFVVYLHMGVGGAAWATVISQAVSAISSLAYGFLKNPYFRLSRENLKIDRNICEKCVRVGVPLSAQSTFIAISCVVLQRVVNGFDDVAVSAFTVTNRIEQLVQQPFSSLGAAASTFTGQNMGAGKTERVRTALRKSTLLVGAFSLFMLAVCFVLGESIVKIFVSEKDVIEIGAKGLKITATMFFPLGMIHVTRGILNGAGDAAYAMVNGIIAVAGSVGFSLLLVSYLDIGLYAVWLTTGFTWIITALSGAVRYKQGKWAKIKLTEKE